MAQHSFDGHIAPIIKVLDANRGTQLIKETPLISYIFPMSSRYNLLPLVLWIQYPQCYL